MIKNDKFNKCKNLVGKDTHPTILIKTIQKKQDLSEHILEAKFMLLKANLMTGQDKVCK